MSARDENKLYLIESKLDEKLDDSSRFDQRAETMCPGCPQHRLGLYPSPLLATIDLRQRASLSFAFGIIHVMKRSLFDKLQPFAPDMIPGEVRFRDGRLLKTSVSVQPSPEMTIVLRGREEKPCGAYYMCKICSRPTSIIGFTTKPWYALRSELPDRELLFSREFLFTEKVKSSIDWDEFPDIKFTPIAVFDQILNPVAVFGDPMPEASE